ncbi:hypothetical protein AYO40_00425 [Planctomycetaceae bacterium SCGC AG-212-D15]|nr:hypothetical protein AYO40_00425 [Planctomycetaceae bacterium SCGC AG-212-D15]
MTKAPVSPSKDTSRWPIAGHDPGRWRYAPKDLEPPLRVAWKLAGLADTLSQQEITGAPEHAFCCSGDGSLFALNEKKKRLWDHIPKRARDGSPPTGPSCLLGSRVIFPTEERLQCFSAEDGVLQWELQNNKGKDVNRGEPIFAHERDFGEGILGVTKDHQVVTASAWGVIRWIDSVTGDVVSRNWPGGTSGRTYAAGDRIFIFTAGKGARSDDYSGQMLDLHAGRSIARFEPPSEGATAGGFMNIGGRCYWPTNSFLMCFDADSGKTIWAVDYSKEGQPDDQGLQLASDGTTVFSQRGDSIVAYHAETGKQRWRTAPKTNSGWPYYLENALVVSPHYVYVVTSDLSLQVLDKTSGKQVWQSKKEMFGAYLSKPSVIGEHMYLLDADQVYCLGSQKD